MRENIYVGFKNADVVFFMITTFFFFGKYDFTKLLDGFGY